MNRNVPQPENPFARHKKKLKGLAVIAAGVIIAAVVYTAVSVEDTTLTATAPTPKTKVALATVERSNVPRFISGIGELEAARQVQVAAEVGGRATKILFESGQSVAAGQLLVQLNDAPEQAERIRLQAQLRNAQSVHTRTRKLVAANAATQEQLDTALAARDMALGELGQTQAKIAQKAIRAPFAGVIGIRRVHEGQYLNAGDPIASLVDARTLHANFSLDEQSSPALHIGQSVQVLVDALAHRSFKAKVSAIDPLIGQSRTVQVQATMADPDSLLKAGMYASIQVARRDTQAVLTVPETAVTYTAYGDTVFVAHPDDQQTLIVKRVAVTVGARQEGRVEIEHGLHENEQVVTSGQLKLSDGMAVEAVKEDTLALPGRTPLSSAMTDKSR